MVLVGRLAAQALTRPLTQAQQRGLAHHPVMAAQTAQVTSETQVVAMAAQAATGEVLPMAAQPPAQAQLDQLAHQQQGQQRRPDPLAVAFGFNKKLSL